MSISESLIPEFEHEMASTRRVLARVPVDLRLLDVPVPSTYGPTADEKM